MWHLLSQIHVKHLNGISFEFEFTLLYKDQEITLINE